MSTFRKKPPKTKDTKATAIPAPKPTWAGNALKTVSRAFAPLNKFQKALYYQGSINQKPGRLKKWLAKNNAAIAIFEKIFVLAFIVFSLVFNPYMLLILPAIGAMVFYRNRVYWLWWKLKVFILFRSFYQHRRQLYRQGSLFAHLSHKQPKRFGSAIIWGESESIQNIKFRSLQKSNQLTTKEYISL